MAHRKVTKFCIDCETLKPRAEFEFGTKNELRDFCVGCRDKRNVRRYKACTAGRLRYLSRIKHTYQQRNLTCKACHETKPLSAFAHAVRKGNRRYYRRCKECYNTAQRLTRITTGYTKLSRADRKVLLANRRANVVPTVLRQVRIDPITKQKVKRCSQCGVVKPLTEMSREGRRPNCKACNRNAIERANSQRRARMYNVRYEPVDREDFIARDGPYCYLCERFLTPEQITLDHVIPIARGGDHIASNLRVACRRCNSRKQARMNSELPWVRHPLFAV